MTPSRNLALIPFLLAAVFGSPAQSPQSPSPIPDEDGVYYVGPSVSAPRLVMVAAAGYPPRALRRDVQGMTVLAMVIQPNGRPAHIQVLHSHGDAYDRAAQAAVEASTFAPGILQDRAVPVWVDVRVVFGNPDRPPLPEVLITERDLAPPDPALLADKHGQPLPYIAPIPIHTVDADFDDPFATHPYIQVAIVGVLVGADGLPKEEHIVRGLGFGLDEKAIAAVQHYRFLPATRRGRPVQAYRNVEIRFAKF